MKYEKSKVVMLPTEKASKIIKEDGVLKFNPSNIDVGIKEYQHLYFLSDEEIKEGDWCLDKYNQIWRYSNGKLRSCDKLGIERFTTDNIEGQEVKKIIATTDKLRVGSFMGFDTETGEDLSVFLPRPSNEFLKKYCELGGIDEVLVEYEGIEWLDRPLEYFPKVAPDNTITIKPIKNSWNWKEIEASLIYTHIMDCYFSWINSKCR